MYKMFKRIPRWKLHTAVAVLWGISALVNFVTWSSGPLSVGLAIGSLLLMIAFIVSAVLWKRQFIYESATPTNNPNSPR